MFKIVKIIGCEIIDFCGNLIVEVEVYLEGGFVGMVVVLLGAFIGFCEVLELCDGDKFCFLGKGVIKVVVVVNGSIVQVLIGKDVKDQVGIDKIMIDLDGIENKFKFGVNVILVVFLVNVKVVVVVKGMLLYEYIVELNGILGKYFMLVLMMNIINGGEYVDNNVDIQEFMIQLVGVKIVKEVICMGFEVFYYLVKVLKVKGMNIVVGDEGGYVLNLGFNVEVLVVIVEVVKVVGYELGKDIILVMDCVVFEFYKDGKYVLVGEGNKVFIFEEFIYFLEELIKQYLIVFIEDGLDEFDWDGFVYQIKVLGDKIQLVGDDLFVINIKILKEGIEKGIVNFILIKFNQIGFLIEILVVIKMVKDVGYIVVIFYCFGEIEDVIIVDLVVGIVVGQIKIGFMSCFDCVVKYNQLICIEEVLGEKVLYNGCKEIKGQV